MTGLNQVLGNGARIRLNANGFGTVRRADASGDAPRRIDTHLEIRLKCLSIGSDHPFDHKLFKPYRSSGDANEPTTKLRHEVDRLRGDMISGHDQVAFVLTFGVIHDHDHL